MNLSRAPAWYDAQYNNRALVPEHGEIFARWAADSARTRATREVRLDLRYGDGPNETLDVFPAARPGAPVLVFIHGGYWRSLDKADSSFVADALVDAGATVVVPNYALCPSVGIDDIALQCARAVAWTWRHAEEHRGDRRRIVVAGHSAGGHLAAMLLATPARAWGLDRHPVAGAASISGVHDLRPLTLFSFNVDFRLDDAEAARMSPILVQPATDAPIVVAVGADETSEFLRQAGLLWEAWPANRPRGACGPMLVPDRNHFSVIADYADAQSALTRATLALF